MKARDRAVIAVLVLALVGLAVAIGIQSLPSNAPATSPSQSVAAVRPYMEGVVGRATAVSPLSARSEVDRQLVALVFSGLLRNGPDGTLVGDLADQWTFEADGTSATFHLRDTARWQDGEPVTAADVAFTVRILQDPDYTGPGGGSWREVTVRAIDEHSVRFDLATPLGGFLQAATQPLVPAHLLADIPIGAIADSGFERAPIGSGPFRLVSLDDQEAVLEPAVLALPDAATPAPGSPEPGSPDPASGIPTIDPGDVLGASPQPGIADQRIPYLAGMTFRFFDTSEDLAAAFEGGEFDAVSGLTADDATRLAAVAGNRLLRYPTTTLTAVILNLRGDRTLFKEATIRRALLEGMDRPGLVADAFGGYAQVADAPIPPSSWAFDREASAPVAHDLEALAKDMTDTGWERIDGTWRPADGEGPFTLELMYAAASAGTAGSADAVAQAIAAGWTAAGLDTTAVPLPAAEFAGARLREGEFDAALVSVSIGLDPDLYPLLASTQATRGGSNYSGIQDAALDALLEAARAAGTEEARKAAYAALQVRLAERQYLLPVAFRETVVVVRDTLSGPEIRTLGDPGDRFWDVLTWRLAYDR